MKKKNLEKAVILGLLLSAGIYGTAWAENYTEEHGSYNTSINDADNTVSGNVEFNLDTPWIKKSEDNITITGNNNSSITVETSGVDQTYGQAGIVLENGSLLKINELNNLTITVGKGSQGARITYGLVSYNGNAEINLKEDFVIDAVNQLNNSASSSNGLTALIDKNQDMKTKITANSIKITATNAAGNDGKNYNKSTAIKADYDVVAFVTGKFNGINKNEIVLTGTGEQNNIIAATGQGIYSSYDKAVIKLTSDLASNKIYFVGEALAQSCGVGAAMGSIEIWANKDNVISTLKNNDDSYQVGYYGVAAMQGNITLTAEEGSNKILEANEGIVSNALIPIGEGTTERKIILTAGKDNIISSKKIAVDAGYNYHFNITSNNGKNFFETTLYETNGLAKDTRSAIKVDNAVVNIIAKNNTLQTYADEVAGRNIVRAGKIDEIEVNGIKNFTGDYYALTSKGNVNADRSELNLNADTANLLYGAVSGTENSEITIEGKNNLISSSKSNNNITLGKDDNYYIAVNATGDKELTGENRTAVNITATNGGRNEIYSNVIDDDVKSERTVFATEGGVVNITGTSIITADGWAKANESSYQTNNTSQALIAGTHDWNNAEKDENDKIIFDIDDNKRSVINLNYGNGSAVTGDIAAGYAGAVNIIGQSADGITTFANNGEETVSASNSLQLNGNVLAANGGKVKLELGKGSVWHGRADDYQDAAENSNWGEEHLGEFEPVFSNGIQEAGTVDVTLKDGATWDVMGQSWLTTLDGTGGVIDMRNTNGDASRTSHAVHIGELNGSHTFVMDLDTNHTDSDMLYIKDMGTNSGTQTLWINSINGLENLDENDTLRFATVKSGDIQFEGQYKFGDYGEAKNGIMLMDNGVLDTAYKIYREEYDSAKVEENTGYNGGDTFDEVKPGNSYVEDNYAEYNWYLAKDTSYDQTSDAGKTIINMSRANYKNAIYMDRLNKRMGEMRYVNGEEEQGLWVRLRHDRIGQSGDFRSMNTMYEVGYDVKQPTDNGEHRIGMAIDYMRGSTTYDNIMGKGETKRYGLWLYDTWLGEKGHYVDYVAKWGHLSNDFDITAKTTGEKINGDYSNNVFSVSAEYGKKNDMGNNWYFEPQAQLQLARVTGADYVTTQGSKVNVDGINSLIGRAGFRIGRDMDENSTVYLKADLLHEFMGDQTVTAADATGTLREEFENKGTWYDVGFGFAAKMSKNSYAFMDFEKSFGNDNDETYQINAGMQWTF